MPKQKASYRFSFLIIAVTLLFSLIWVVACSEPNSTPSQTPSPPQTTSPTPEPTPTPPPVPMPKPLPPKPPEEAAPEVTGPTGGPVQPHTFWGHVKTDTGEPASEVEITVLVDGKQQYESITTDASGKYGGNLLIELPTALSVTGQNGNKLEFHIDGIAAEETRLGTLVKVDEKYQWDWQDLEPEWELIFVSGEHNGLDLVYTP